MQTRHLLAPELVRQNGQGRLEKQTAFIEAGMSVKGRVIDERFVHPDGYEEQIIVWVDQGADAGQEPGQ